MDTLLLKLMIVGQIILVSLMEHLKRALKDTQGIVYQFHKI